MPIQPECSLTSYPPSGQEGRVLPPGHPGQNQRHWRGRKATLTHKGNIGCQGVLWGAAPMLTRESRAILACLPTEQQTARLHLVC